MFRISHPVKGGFLNGFSLKQDKDCKTMKVLSVRNFFLSVFIFAFVSFYSYIFPRFLVSLLGEKSLWISYFYTYGMGLIFFLLSVIWIFTREGADPDRRKSEWFWLLAILCGFLFMFCLHGLWIFIASNYPLKA